MEKLKIKVESEAESKEVQELFFELGYKWANGKVENLKINEYPTIIRSHIPGSMTWSLGSERFYKEHKEITLPELRDMVVLKRNDATDCTHWHVTGQANLPYLFAMDEWYFFGRNGWEKSTHTHEFYNRLKPIEKKEMKEYLVKNENTGAFDLFRKYPDFSGESDMEIPEGAESYTTIGLRDFTLSFYKDNFRKYCNENTNFEWRESTTELSERKGFRVLWQRHMHPEELPFVDDEPSLNDQYAEIERVRQSDKVLKEILEGDLPEFDFTANKPRNAVEIATDAMQHIADRAATYDQADGERSAHKTAMAFNAITGKDLTEGDIWHILSLLKMVRQCSRDKYHRDSAEDLISYSALWAESLERDA